jgi:hypothetical protein
LEPIAAPIASIIVTEALSSTTFSFPPRCDRMNFFTASMSRTVPETSIALTDALRGARAGREAVGLTFIDGEFFRILLDSWPLTIVP